MKILWRMLSEMKEDLELKISRYKSSNYDEKLKHLDRFGDYKRVKLIQIHKENDIEWVKEKIKQLENIIKILSLNKRK